MRPVRPLVIVVLLSAAAARAQTIPTFNLRSIESEARAARAIFVGVVAGFDGRKGDIVHTVTFDVAESLKGEAGKAASVHFFVPGEKLAAWMKNRSRILVLVDSEPKQPFLRGPRTTAIELGSADLQVPTADLTVLQDGEQVLANMRRTFQDLPPARAKGEFESTIDPEVFAAFPPLRQQWNGRLVVPMDERLEKRARLQLGSDRYDMRREGLRALGFFRSEENARLIEPLLADPYTDLSHVAEMNLGIDVVSYPIREQTYKILKGWGMAPAQEPELGRRVSRLATIESMEFLGPVTDAGLETLLNAPKLRSLWIERRQSMTDAQFAIIGRLSGLKILTLYGVASDRRLKLLTGLKKLEYLDVRLGPITDAGVATLTAFPRLRWLGLSNTRVTDACLKSVLEMPALQRLGVESTKVSEAGVARLRRQRPNMQVDRVAG